MGRQPQAPDQQRVEAGGRDPGGGHDDDRADVVGANAGGVEEAARDGVEELDGGVEIERIALGPAMRLAEPLERHRGIAPADAAIGEDRQQVVELRRPGEQPLHMLGDCFLVERIGGDRGRDRGQARDGLHRIAFWKPPEARTQRYRILLPQGAREAK